MNALPLNGLDKPALRALFQEAQGIPLVSGRITLFPDLADTVISLALRQTGWPSLMKFVTGTGNFIGLGTINDKQQKIPEIGIALLNTYKGQGLGAEGIGGLLQLCFRDAGHDFVRAATHPDNKPCIGALKANGLVLVSSLSSETSSIFEISRDQWNKQQRAIRRTQLPALKAA